MKTIKVSSIKVPESFLKSNPKIEKIKKIKRYVAKNGELDKPVVLYDDNTITDNYIRYLVAVELGLEEIPFITTQEYKKECDKSNPITTYVVGMFYNCPKKYVWKNPKDIPVEIGDKVLVHSKDKFNKKNGRTVVTVTDVYKSNNPKLQKHKNIIKVVERVNNES